MRVAGLSVAGLVAIMVMSGAPRTAEAAREAVLRAGAADTTEECKFATGGSMCEILIPANDPAYGRIVAEFKRGFIARVTVLDAGVMKMDEKLSLRGFTKAFR